MQRSKHHDDKLVLGGIWRPRRDVAVVGEAALYQWGLRGSSAELLPGPRVRTPIWKKGFWLAFDWSRALPHRGARAGVVFVHEELDRDDSLVAFLAARDALGVRLGETERATIVRLYAETQRVTAYAFWNALRNPFPQASAIVPIEAPFAFTGAGDKKLGLGFRLRASF